MSLTGKTISELPLLTGFSENISIPVEISGVTYHTKPSTLQSSRTWRALLTQTGPLTLGGEPFQGLIFNEIYTIDSYTEGDDFSNIAEVISGVINTTGCVFRATGTTSTVRLNPNTWDNSTLISDGNMIVNVLENTLGFNVDVDYPAFNTDGIVAFFPNVDLPTFLPQKTIINTQTTMTYDASNYPTIVTDIITGVDSTTIVMQTINPNTNEVTGNLLYNTPVEIIVYN